MSEYHQSDDASQDESWSARERTVERFQAAWRQGGRPVLDEYLRGGEARMPELLIQLICAELELRLQAGESARVEEYLTRYPQLGEDRQAVFTLLQTEARLRLAPEPRLSGEEYRRRFPVFGDELSEEFSTLSREALPPFPATLDTRPSKATLTARSDLPDIPGFELIKELGRGAMGVVYLARQLGLARLVALKIILRADHANSENRQRFHIEARALARLKHPNIVQIYEVSEYRDQPFFVLEYVEGSTLADRLANSPCP